MMWIRALFCVGGLVLSGCRDPGAAAPPEPERPTEAVHDTRWVAVARPADASLLEAPAIVRAAPDASGDVAATFRARVERVHVQVGSRVERNAPVVDVLAPELLEAAAVYFSSERRLEFYEARVKELEALRAEGLVEVSRVFEQRMLAAELEAKRDEARAVLRGGGISVAAARALTQSGTLTLRAPVAGIVSELDANPGEMRDVGGAPLARIRGQGSVRIEVRTPGPWPDAEGARLELPGGETLTLAPKPIASVVEPESGNRVHWLEPEQPSPLSDGLRGVVRLAAGASTWEVPPDAVLQEGTSATVLRRRAGNVVRVDVQILASSGASTLVRGPLEPGDEVAMQPRKGAEGVGP